MMLASNTAVLKWLLFFLAHRTISDTGPVGTVVGKEKENSEGGQAETFLRLTHALALAMAHDLPFLPLIFS